jgi:hypothetical protein
MDISEVIAAIMARQSNYVIDTTPISRPVKKSCPANIVPLLLILVLMLIGILMLIGKLKTRMVITKKTRIVITMKTRIVMDPRISSRTMRL